jgi:hypothetical protein
MKLAQTISFESKSRKCLKYPYHFPYAPLGMDNFFNKKHLNHAGNSKHSLHKQKKGYIIDC